VVFGHAKQAIHFIWKIISQSDLEKIHDIASKIYSRLSSSTILCMSYRMMYLH